MKLQDFFAKKSKHFEIFAKIVTLYIGSVYRLHPPTQLLYMALQFSCMHEQTGSQACGGACILGLNKQAARPVVVPAY